MHKLILLFFVFFPFCLCGNTGCDKQSVDGTGSRSEGDFDILTDRVRYEPGQSVRFCCSGTPGDGLLYVRY